jgi:hypothetical protein
MLVSDKFAAVAAASATDYDELAIALSKVASQANLAGMSIDYTTALLTKGLETTREAPETMGTALKTIIARMRELGDYGETLEGDTDINNVESQLAYVGIALRNTEGELRSTEDVLDELGKKWDTLNKIEQRSNEITKEANEAFETLKNLKIKRNVKGEVYISDCALCDGVVMIPYGINIIDKEAFSSQENLVELHLPGTVRVIKESAFSDCSSLERIVFAEGIEVIENAAFSGCTALSELDLPSTLKSVGNEAFADCENLADVHFANLRTSVQDDAFDGCIFEISSIQEAEASPAECF